jgi:hypothetical protein
MFNGAHAATSQPTLLQKYRTKRFKIRLGSKCHTSGRWLTASHRGEAEVRSQVSPVCRSVRDTGHLTTLYDKPPYRSVFSRDSDGSRSSLKMADYCRNMYEPAYMNKAVVQICAVCWLFLLRLIMHGTNIKFFRHICSVEAIRHYTLKEVI